MSAPTARAPALAGRQIGPIGTSARLLGGATAVGVPIALHGLSWLEAGLSLVALRVIAALAAPLITAAYRRLHSGPLPSGHAMRLPLGCSLIAVMVVANAALVAPTDADGNVTIWVWLGVSMLIAAARGYAGCEVLAIPNLITGRREQIGCILYTPIDAREARRRAGRCAAQRRGNCSGASALVRAPR